jgi:hypothetical protein
MQLSLYNDQLINVVKGMITDYAQNHTERIR